jgi:hypothetical protein
MTNESDLTWEWHTKADEPMRGPILGKFEENPSTGVSLRAVPLRIVFHTLGQ